MTAVAIGRIYAIHATSKIRNYTSCRLLETRITSNVGLVSDLVSGVMFQLLFICFYSLQVDEEGEVLACGDDVQSISFVLLSDRSCNITTAIALRSNN